MAVVSYTWGKGLSDAYDRNTTPFAYQDPRNRRAEMQPMPFDLTQNLAANFVYAMPFLNRFKGVSGGFLKGWQVNGIVSMHAGFADTLSGGNLNNGGYSRPDLIGNRQADQPDAARLVQHLRFRPHRLHHCCGAGLVPLRQRWPRHH